MSNENVNAAGIWKFGDTLPVNIATQLPLLGESAVELRFMPLDTLHFAVFANGVFFTYCRRV